MHVSRRAPLFALLPLFWRRPLRRMCVRVRDIRVCTHVCVCVCVVERQSAEKERQRDFSPLLLCLVLSRSLPF